MQTWWRPIGLLARRAGVRGPGDVRRCLDEAVVATRADERGRFRRELHDVLGPTMTAATMRADVARYRLDGSDPAAAAILDLLLGDLRRATEDVRRMAGQVDPDTPSSALLLVEALRREAGRFEEASNGRLQVRVVGPARQRRLPHRVDLAVRRVVGEALTNTVRHSGARHCHVHLEVHERDIRVEIRDDGDGDGGPDTAPGVGLRSMAARVRELDGTFRIGRNHPTGVRVVARMPLEDAS